jgi:predicted nuclease with TOPRIM domain
MALQNKIRKLEEENTNLKSIVDGQNDGLSKLQSATEDLENENLELRNKLKGNLFHNF